MDEATAVGLSKLGTIMLGVRDMERSIAFYREVLGLAVRFAGPEFAFLDGGGVTLALRSTANLGGGGDERRTELVFDVDDIDAALVMVAP